MRKAALVFLLLPSLLWSARQFDGIDDAVEWDYGGGCWHVVITTQGSVQFWWKADYFDDITESPIMMTGMEFGRGYEISLYSAGVYAWAFMDEIGGWDWNVWTASFTQGVWYHVSVVKSSTDTWCYINGRAATRTRNELSTNTWAVTSILDRMTMGYDGTLYAKGSIADLRFWNRPLSGNECAANYSTYVGKQPGLTAMYRLDEPYGSIGMRDLAPTPTPYNPITITGTLIVPDPPLYPKPR